MLYDAEHTRRIVHTLKAHFTGSRPLPPLVVDPVSVSTSGHTLLHPGAVDLEAEEKVMGSTDRAGGAKGVVESVLARLEMGE